MPNNFIRINKASLSCDELPSIKADMTVKNGWHILPMSFINKLQQNKEKRTPSTPTLESLSIHDTNTEVSSRESVHESKSFDDPASDVPLIGVPTINEIISQLRANPKLVCTPLPSHFFRIHH
jgi:hypothetical protein